MPIRIWLSLAECPRCDLRVPLSQAQEQQALALVRESLTATAEPEAASAPQPSLPPIALPANKNRPAKAVVPVPSPSGAPRKRAARAANEPVPASRWADWLAASERFFLCWLVSAAAHMLLVILLGIWLIHESQRAAPILLAATISDTRGDDGIERVEALPDEIIMDEVDSSPVTGPPASSSAADNALVESITTVEPPPGELLAKADLGKLPVGNLAPSQVLAGRDAGVRGQLVAREGGTSESEAAVGRALKWLARHQTSDGSWSLNRFNTAGDCDGRCGDPGSVESDTAATSLALLPFLGAGQTHLRGDHTLTVARGLRALIDLERSDGDLRGRGSGNMYAHGQATIALCEAYAMTQAENLRDPAQRAVDFIVAAQHEAGGWRYGPGEPGDLSVVGWQMMALRSAQMAYLKVPDETFLKATRFLNSVQQGQGVGLYGYMPGLHANQVMTAEGLLCRQYSGWRHNHPVLINGVVWLETNHLPRADRPNMYFWYYGTQVMHHMGGKTWEKWNAALRDLLISLQAGGGHQDGSWPPLGGHDSQGGRLYTTALAACTLEVYYRHLPLYRGIAGGGSRAK
jgi:hypothetical protein